MTWSPDAVDAQLRWAVPLWNVVGLPTLLLAVAIGSLRRPRSWADRRGVVRRLGLGHYGLAAWSLTTVAAELWEARAMGVLPSNPVTGLPGSVLLLLLDVPLGAGLRRFWRSARWAAILLALVRTGIAAGVIRFLLVYDAPVNLVEWPGLAASWAWPPFELVALLLPGTARVFRDREEVEDPRAFDVALALASRLLLVVLASAVLTDAIDWALRASAGPP